MEAPGVNGYAAFKVADAVTSFQRLRDGQLQLLQPGRGHLRRPRLRGARPRSRPGSLHDLLTIFLDPSVGKGGILQRRQRHRWTVDDREPDVPVTVVSYP